MNRDDIKKVEPRELVKKAIQKHQQPDSGQTFYDWAYSTSKNNFENLPKGVGSVIMESCRLLPPNLKITEEAFGVIYMSKRLGEDILPEYDFIGNLAGRIEEHFKGIEDIDKKIEEYKKRIKEVKDKCKGA